MKKPLPKSKSLKQAKTYSIFAIGCQQNWYDAEKIAHTLDLLGLFPETVDTADLIVILSCSVRQKSVDKLYGFINKWRKIKPRHIILTACILPADRKTFATKVDAIIEDQQIYEYLIDSIPHADNITLADLPADHHKEGLNVKMVADHAFVPITFGCNNYCTFCAVPHTRGREVSRPKTLVLAETNKLFKKGIKKITLLGQNVNSYGLSDFTPRNLRKNKDQSGVKWSKSNPSPFVELLNDIEKNIPLESLSFLSPNPQDFAPDLIDWMSKSKIFSRSLNLPLQSGNDKVLKQMNRRYTSKEYLTLLQKIRQAVPDIVVSTDIIVGFPNESAEDFADTVKLCQKANFNKAFIGIFSPRPGTTAAKIYPDNVPMAVKKERFKILNELINSQELLINPATGGRQSSSFAKL